MSRPTIRTSLLGVAVLALLVGAFPARGEVILNDTVPFAAAVPIPCAGELALMSGPLHVLLTATADGNGGVHLTSHFQPQGVSGVGSISGNKYQGTGVTRDETNVTSGGAFETTFVNNFRMIGQGPGNNLLVHSTVHVTVNANGDVTATVSNVSVECK